MVKWSIGKKNMIQLIKIFNFFLACYFLKIFGSSLRDCNYASEKVTHIHKFKHLCPYRPFRAHLKDII